MPAPGLTRFAIMLALHPWLPESPLMPSVPQGGRPVAERVSSRDAHLGGTLHRPAPLEIRPDLLFPQKIRQISRIASADSLLQIENRALIEDASSNLAAFGHKHPDSRHVGMQVRLVMPRGEFLTGFESLDWDADFRFLPRRRGRRLGPNGSLRLNFGQRQHRAGFIAWARLWPLGGEKAWESDIGAGVEGQAALLPFRRGQWVGAWRGRTRLVAARTGADLLRLDGAMLPKSLLAQSDFSLTESVRGFEDEHQNVRALSFVDVEFGYARGKRLRMVVFASLATHARAQDAASSSYAPVRWATGTLLRFRPGGERGRLQFSYQLTQRQRMGQEPPWMHLVMLET